MGYLKYVVYVFDMNVNFNYMFILMKGFRGCKMMISGKDKLMVLRKYFRNCVDVYKIDGQFFCSFGE